MKFLSVFVLLLAALCYAKAEELTKESVVAAMTACKEEAGGSDDDLEAIKHHQPATTPEGKCMNACIMKKFGLMNEEGKLARDIAIEVGKAMIKEEDKKELVVAIIDACEPLEVDADHCEAASQYGACIREHSEEHDLKWEEH